MTGRRRAKHWWLAGAGAFLLAALAVYLGLTGYFSGDARYAYAADGRPAPVAAMLVSGDSGLRFGMGPVVAKALAAHGVPVLGFNSPTLFRFGQTRPQLDARIAAMVRETLRETGRDRLVLIGQSFGADVLQTGLAALPADLRRHVAAIVLVVPSREVFFRADPSGLAYRATPDSLASETLPRLDWAPLTCIHGKLEADSACPGLKLPNATVIAMPGGHFLGRDDKGLVGHVLAALGRVTDVKR